MTGVAGFAQPAARNAKFKMQNANAAREAQPTPALCILNLSISQRR
jgi:hypothetical protein